ncbi:hypothetical protein ACFL6C_04035 [Myxococcota bacterium]
MTNALLTDELLRLLGDLSRIPDIPPVLRMRLYRLIRDAMKTGDGSEVAQFLLSTNIAARLALSDQQGSEDAPFDRPPPDVQGALDFAHSLNGLKVGPNRTTLPSINLDGTVGEGKTSTARHIVDKAIQSGIVVWIFDLKEGVDYADFGTKYGIPIVPITAVRQSALRPELIDFFITIFCRAAYLQSAEYLLRSAIRLLTQPDRRPGLIDLAKWLVKPTKNLTPNEQRLIEQIVLRLQPFVEATGEAFAHYEGASIEKLARTSIIFVADTDDAFVLSVCAYCLIYSLIDYRRRNDLFGDGCDNLVVLEEVNKLSGVSAEAERDSRFKTDLLGPILQVAREFMVRFLLSSSIPCRTSLTGNTALKIYYRQSNTENMERNARALALDPAQRHYYFKECRQGRPLCVVPTPTFNAAFPVIAYPPLPKTRLTRTELQEAYERSLKEINPPIQTKVAASWPSPVDWKTRQQTEPTEEDELKLLETLYENLFIAFTELTNLSAINGNPQKLRKRLVKKGFIKEVMDVPGMGTRAIFCELQHPAFERLERPSPYKGKGGFAHRYWSHRVTKGLEASGWTVKAEHQGCDLYCERSEERFCVEITLSTDNVSRNAQRNLEKLKTQTVFLVPKEGLTKAVHHKLQGIEGVQVATCESFLSKANPNPPQQRERGIA